MPNQEGGNPGASPILVTEELVQQAIDNIEDEGSDAPQDADQQSEAEETVISVDSLSEGIRFTTVIPSRRRDESGESVSEAAKKRYDQSSLGEIDPYSIHSETVQVIDDDNYVVFCTSCGNKSKKDDIFEKGRFAIKHQYEFCFDPDIILSHRNSRRLYWFCFRCLHVCAVCGKLLSSRDAIRQRDKDGGTIYKCRKCTDSCAICGEPNTAINWVQFGGKDINICDRCRAIAFYECEGGCGKRIYALDIEYCPYCNAGIFCKSCLPRHIMEHSCYDDRIITGTVSTEEEESILRPYSRDAREGRNNHNGRNINVPSIQRWDFKPIMEFIHSKETHLEETKNYLYLGVELEIDHLQKERAVALARRLYKMDSIQHKIYLKQDGSLRTYGFELVSMPSTIKAHKNLLDWPMLMDLIRSYGAESEEGGFCGLHIHFNKTYFHNNKHSQSMVLNVVKLVHLFERLYDYFLVFSRRRMSGLEPCRPNKVYDKSKPLSKLKREERDREFYKQGEAGRYQAINIMNNSTIEIRLWRGTLDPLVFFATLEFTRNIIKIVKGTSMEGIQSMTWKELCEKALKYNFTTHLEKYLERMGLIDVHYNNQT